MNVIAAVHEGRIDVSVVGLIVGLVLAGLIYLAADAAASASGTPLVRIVGAVIAVLVFLVLGFDYYG